ncbi:hypothetical protein NQT62_03670 [Limnobacter humi]|uniref:Uncharacterized protein n=1 Tax=Limnobacter humi TaxID=1778671 RepID=A0ABT1WGI5_9BURK|nr:hypothetical protein [Limnobacter humi]MCQ8895539.1 hypothetical protein [Limnobacter humi]
MSSINPNQRLSVMGNKRLNKALETEAQQVSDQRDSIVESDVWGLKERKRLDRPCVDWSKGEKRNVKISQVNDRPDGSTHNHAEALSAAGLFQSLLFQSSSSHDSHGNGGEESVDAVIEMRKRLIWSADNKGAEQPREHGESIGGREPTRYLAEESTIHADKQSNATLEEFQLTDPQYGQLTIRVKKQDSCWILELVTESMAQKKGIQQFASIIEAGLKTRLSVDLRIQIS